jgi:RND superfamily putative drug exporter
VSTPFARRTLWRSPAWAMVIWLAIAAALSRFAVNLEDVLQVTARAAGSESDAAQQAQANLPQGDAQYAVLVARGIDPRSSPRDRGRLDSLAAAVRTAAPVTRVRAYEGPTDSLLVGDGGTVVLAVLDTAAGSPDRTIPLLREITRPIADRWVADGVTIRWTGEAAVNYDLRKASARDASLAERRALPITALILILAFGTVVAAGVPVLVGVLTIVCALGVAGLVGRTIPLSLMLQSVVTMIGLGLGIDYGLLMVSRFREARHDGMSRLEAARVVASRGGRTILLSGAAVMLGFAGLMTVPQQELRSVGFGGLTVVVIAVALSTTLLPRLLVLLGPSLDWLRLRPRTSSTVGASGWERWGMWVTARPVAVLTAAGLPLVWLCWQATGIHISTPNDNWLPRSLESVAGIEDLRETGLATLMQRTRVVVRLRGDRDVLSEDGWAAVREVRATLLADRRTDAVVSFARLDTDRPPSRLALLATPRRVRDAYLSEDRHTVLLDAIPTEQAASGEMTAFVADIRHALNEPPDGVSKVLVGGVAAFQLDYSNSVSGYLPRVVAIVVTGTFIALAIGFRSILIPAKALVLNLLSVTAAFGVVKLVFQDGLGIGLTGLAAPVSSVFPVIPTLVFCTVFGLSMDYEVFLVARVAEYRRGGVSERDSIALGLARSAPVISSAAAIMVVVFGAFASGEYLAVKMLGLALAAAVFIDATLVRVAVGPALLTLAGRWNWWPGIWMKHHD